MVSEITHNGLTCGLYKLQGYTDSGNNMKIPTADLDPSIGTILPVMTLQGCHKTGKAIQLILASCMRSY